MNLVRLLSTIVCVLFLVPSCQHQNASAPFIQLKLDLDEQQSRELLDYISTYMTIGGGYKNDDLVFSTAVLNQGLTKYIAAQPVDHPFTLVLRPKDPDSSAGLISWYFVDQRGQQHEEIHPTTTEQVNTLWQVVQTWQQSTSYP